MEFQKERFKKLIQSVEKAPEDRFEMGVWGTFDYAGMPGTIKCGTKACAAGWYIHDNPDCGLILKDNYVYLNVENPDKGFPIAPSKLLAKHFGITYDESWVLFVFGCKYQAEVLKDLKRFYKEKTNGIQG